MGYYITNECINCGACVLECPEDAIYEPNKKYKFEGKTHDAISSVHYYIASFICDECENFTVPKCSAVCPMASIKRK
ncbi:MAG: 4Fe-4S binding protein [Ignavibacteriae bacterium]|nr:4Fe-4S dicluster domain-containing protein [Ignavibacteriota bacterium]NOG98585.1 4Fe-4S binding protein [Ignavibacteriota bacterium]